MRVWIVEIGEPIPGLDEGERAWRGGMLARAAAAYGHEVTWWASTFHHAHKRQRFDSERRIAIDSNITVWCLYGRGYRTNASLSRLIHHRQVASAFRRQARCEARPDVIFCCLPSLELADEAVKYGLEAGVPVMIDIRDLWPDHYLTLAPERARGLARVALASEFRRARRALTGATGISAISQTFLEWGLRHAGRAQRDDDGVFPMGYPSPTGLVEQQAEGRREELRIQLGVGADEFVVLFVGTFVRLFDLETVIRAAGALKDEPFRFVLVGDGPEAERLRALAAALPNVVFTGWQNDVSIRALLALSSVGIAPYSDRASMSLPNKPYEYLSAGLPIVSSLGGELAALLKAEDVGRRYSAGNGAELAGCLRELSQDRAARSAMAARARALFETRYRADIVYASLTRHLEQVARGHPGERGLPLVS